MLRWDITCSSFPRLELRPRTTERTVSPLSFPRRYGTPFPIVPQVPNAEPATEEGQKQGPTLQEIVNETSRKA
jgi:hypothetical protein